MPEKKKGVKSPHKVRKVILSIAIAILFVLFVAYAIETIYPSPTYEKFCPTVTQSFVNQSDCEANNFTWVNTTPANVPSPEKTVPVATGYCDTYTQCNQKFTDASAPYNRNVFFISIVIGLLVVIISLVFAVESVGAGLMGGGVLLMIYGTIRYWGSLSNILRTIMIGIALLVLIWIGYKKLK